MKKVLPGLLFIVAIFSTGCLGESPQQILGQWNYVTNINPNQDAMNWNFLDNGQVIMTNGTTSACDTGTYEMFMDGTHQVVKVKGVSVWDAEIPMNGEWIIVKINYDELAVGTRDYGGFIQRDLTR